MRCKSRFHEQNMNFSHNFSFFSASISRKNPELQFPNTKHSEKLNFFAVLLTIILLTYVCRLWEQCVIFVGTVIRLSFKHQSIYEEIYSLLINVASRFEVLTKNLMYCSRWNTKFTPSTCQVLRRLYFFIKRTHGWPQCIPLTTVLFYTTTLKMKNSLLCF